MNIISDALKASVKAYCAAIGTDPLLVQGAGGNASWKEGNILWVKASGTWLADAAEKNIFVPVDLLHLRNAIGSGNFSVTPKLRGESTLRPSIETLLHALMPHRVVVHLHAIEILAYLVRDDCQTAFQCLLDPSINWTMVEYHKPGADLAKALNMSLFQKPMSNVIFLESHGVVIGGENVTEVANILNKLTSTLSISPLTSIINNNKLMPPAMFTQYSPVHDENINQLALNVNLFQRLNKEWVLYPDHVVFLSIRAYTYNSWHDFSEKNNINNEHPELIFIKEHGVFVKPTFNRAKRAQLRCYADILTRQNSDSNIKTLSEIQISELLNWDAEKYRQHMSV